MFPKRVVLRESSAATPLATHTLPSASPWWCFHHLVLLYHLNPLNGEGVLPLEFLSLLPIWMPPAKALSGVLQNHPAMLIRRYVALGCMLISRPLTCNSQQRARLSGP